MTKKVKAQLISRLKSLAWRVGGMVFVAASAWILEAGTIEALNIPPQLVVLLGLIFGEVTKFLNKPVK